MIGISPNFVTLISVGTFSVLKRSRTSVGTFRLLKRSHTSVGMYIYHLGRGEAELSISTILGEAKPCYVYVRL